MEFLVIIIFWVLLCFVVNGMALSRGRDQVGYVILAIFISPLIVILILLLLGNTNEKVIEDSKHFGISKNNIGEQAKVVNSNSSNTVSSFEIVNQTSGINYEDLYKVGNLFEKGILTKDEFDYEKKRILSGNIKSEAQNLVYNYNKICLWLSTEIKKTKYSFDGKINNDLVELITNTFSEKSKSLVILDQYFQLYSTDFVSDITDLSTSYDTIKHYLTPLINTNIVSDIYPHSRLYY